MGRAKKMLSMLVLLSLLITIALSGCGGASNTNSASNTNAKELSYVKLTFYYPGTPQKDQQLVQDAMNKILKAKFNAELELHPTEWGQWAQKKQLMLSSGEDCDMIFAAAWESPGYYAEVARKLFLPVDDLLQRYGQDIIKLSMDGYLEAMKVKGVAYGVAVNKDPVMNTGYWLTKDFATELNLNPDEVAKMTSLEDMEPILAAAKQKHPDITPLHVSLAQGQGIDSFYGANRESGEIGLKDQSKFIVFNSDFLAYDLTKQKTVAIYDIPAYINQAKLAANWLKLGYINSDLATTQVGSGDMIKNGKNFIMGYNISPRHLGEVEKISEVEMFETPITVIVGIKGGVDLCGAATCLPTACSDPERAMMIINESFINKNLMNTFVFGIENTHYTKVSENVIKMTDKAKDFVGTDWELGNWYLGEKGLFTKEDENPDKYAELRKFFDGFAVSPLLGFCFDSSSLVTEMAAHQNVLSQYQSILGNGLLDPVETAKKMKEKDIASGVDKILAEYDKQIKAFLAENK